MLLTAEIDSEEWKPVLEALGVECTLESALLMAQIKEALAGDTKAATFVAKYSGQSSESDENRLNREADTELLSCVFLFRILRKDCTVFLEYYANM